MNAVLEKWIGGREGAINLAILAAIVFIVMPLSMDIFRLNLVGKYLTYAFVAVGLAAGQSARIAAQKRQVRREFPSKRHRQRIS